LLPKTPKPLPIKINLFIMKKSRGISSNPNSGA